MANCQPSNATFNLQLPCTDTLTSAEVVERVVSFLAVVTLSRKPYDQGTSRKLRYLPVLGPGKRCLETKRVELAHRLNVERRNPHDPDLDLLPRHNPAQPRTTRASPGGGSWCFRGFGSPLSVSFLRLWARAMRSCLAAAA